MAEIERKVDLKRLLSSEGSRDFLIRNDNVKVPINNLESKITGLYFCRPSTAFTKTLIQLYNQLVNKIEIVYIPLDKDENSFENHFSQMPWLAVPFSDAATITRIKKTFKQKWTPYLVFIDGDGNVSSVYGVALVRKYEAEAYPFTAERIRELKQSEEPEKLIISSILTSSSKNYLTSNDRGKVDVEDVCGKTVGLFFASSSCPSWVGDFTMVLARVYKELSKENVEIVLVSPDKDKQSFNSIFCLMPWLSIRNTEVVDKLHRTFQVMQYPYMVFVDGDGNVSEIDWIKIIQDYESEAYPFTVERVNQLPEEDRVGKENVTIRSVLDESTYLISNEANQVSVEALEGKTVGLFVVADRKMSSSEAVQFTKKLVSWYDELKKERGEIFEIVTICGDDVGLDLIGALKTLPWLVLPLKGKTCRKLVRYYKPSTFPMVVIFGSDGKPLQPDHVFTPEMLAQLEQTVKAATGSDLSANPYRIRITRRDKDLEKDQKIHFRKILIAMKGGPCTGKSKIADAISDSLRCSVIRFDEILDRFCSNGDSTKLPLEIRNARYDLAFETACNLALDQLLLKRPVVIDSPLARQSHLDRFTRVATEAECKMVVIVECKPSDHYNQQNWFQMRGLKDWDDFAVPESDPFLAVESNNSVPVEVSWLGVDTTVGTLRPDFAGPAIRDLTYNGEACRAELTNWSPENPLHKALLEEEGWQRPGFDNHREQYHYDQAGKLDLAIKHQVPPPTTPGYEEGQRIGVSCCTDGHYIVNFRENGLSYKARCGVCKHHIRKGSPAYTCVHCRTALHKSCAEWDREKAMITSKKLPSYLRTKTSSCWFTNIQACELCKEQPKDMYDKKKSNFKCESCLFETHFTARNRVPQIVRHESHTKQVKEEGHLLTFWVTSSTYNGKYECAACGRPGKFVGYVCNCCFKCYFHVECALLPRPGINKHGGYTHEMEILSEWEDESDEYICRECWKPRKPKCWFYYCDDCDYPVHTYCVKFTEDE